MRVIAGIAKGRRLVGPPGMTTRPMQDRVKEAIFSSLASVVIDADVVDLYAGSGSMGLEALSRGAASCWFVENDRRALVALQANVDAVGLGGTVVRSDVVRFVQSHAPGGFDLGFVDPPYELELASVESVVAGLLRLMTPGATVIVHRRKGEPAPSVAGVALVGGRSYGGAQVWRLEKEKK